MSDELFLAARAATDRSAALERAAKIGYTPLINEDLRAYALRALGEARGKIITGETPFPSVLWLSGVEDTWNGRKFNGNVAQFARLLEDRAKATAAKTTGWVIEPTTCIDGRRTNACTTAMHAMFLDCDGSGSWDLLLTALQQLDFCYVAYQSGGWTADAPKWRVVLPLAESFDTSDERKQLAWKEIYNHARTVLGAIAGLRGSGFDPATETPCCPWFLTERRVASNPERQVTWRPGHSLDLMALALALPPVNIEEVDKHAPARAGEIAPLGDARLEEIVSALAVATANVPGGRRALYLALPGVLLDRGLSADDVLAVVEAVSERYPRYHPEKHADNVHCAKTTIGKWERGDAVTRIGTLNDAAPAVAQVLDKVVPDTFHEGLLALFGQMEAPTPLPVPGGASELPPPPPPSTEEYAPLTLGGDVEEYAPLTLGNAAQAPTPIIPLPTDGNIVSSSIRAIVRKKKNLKSPKARLDGEMLENFMAGQRLVLPSDISRVPALASYNGEKGLHRVAWLLGQNLPPGEISWDAILNSHLAKSVYPRDELIKIGEVYTDAQRKRSEWDRQKNAEKEAQKLAWKANVDRFFDAKRSAK